MMLQLRQRLQGGGAKAGSSPSSLSLVDAGTSSQLKKSSNTISPPPPSRPPPAPPTSTASPTRSASTLARTASSAKTWAPVIKFDEDGDLEELNPEGVVELLCTLSKGARALSCSPRSAHTAAQATTCSSTTCC